MIGRGPFNDQLNRVEGILKKCGLFDARNYSPSNTAKAADFRGLSYREVWRKTIELDAYDFILTDQALLRFTLKEGDEHACLLSYSYLECPVAVMTYEEYCKWQFAMTAEGEDVLEVLSVVGDAFRNEYEVYVETCNLKGDVTPIRYDYIAKDYVAGRHPASHVHFGHNSHVRIATKKVLMPVTFCLSLIRQCYPAVWQGMVATGLDVSLVRSVRTALAEVPGDYWGEVDDYELHLY